MQLVFLFFSLFFRETEALMVWLDYLVKKDTGWVVSWCYEKCFYVSRAKCVYFLLMCAIVKSKCLLLKGEPGPSGPPGATGEDGERVKKKSDFALLLFMLSFILNQLYEPKSLKEVHACVYLIPLLLLCCRKAEMTLGKIDLILPNSPFCQHPNFHFSTHSPLSHSILSLIFFGSLQTFICF